MKDVCVGDYFRFKDRNYKSLYLMVLGLSNEKFCNKIVSITNANIKEDSTFNKHMEDEVEIVQVCINEALG